MRPQEKIMRDAGYVTATEAADAIGVSNIATIHRMVKTTKLLGARAGCHWYVSVASLLREHAGAPPLLERIKALGVKPNPEHEKQIDAKKRASAKGDRRARQTR